MRENSAVMPEGLLFKPRQGNPFSSNCTVAYFLARVWNEFARAHTHLVSWYSFYCRRQNSAWCVHWYQRWRWSNIRERLVRLSILLPVVRVALLVLRNTSLRCCKRFFWAQFRVLFIRFIIDQVWYYMFNIYTTQKFATLHTFLIPYRRKSWDSVPSDTVRWWRIRAWRKRIAEYGRLVQFQPFIQTNFS